MKAFLFVLTFLTINSCTKKAEITKLDTKELTIDSQKTRNEPRDVVEYVETEENFKNDFDILLASEYRDWEDENPANNLTQDWVDLYEKNGKYYLGKPDYTIKRGYSECSGDSTQIIKSKNKTLLFINQLALKFGEINSLNISKNKIWPDEKLSFDFNNTNYSIRAEGKVLSTENVQADNGIEVYKKVENYKLFIKTNSTSESLFLTQSSFNDTFVEILFVGDIDQDGKLDFIFGANRDYEEERVILYLSSKHENGEVIKKTSEIAVQFDC